METVKFFAYLKVAVLVIVSITMSVLFGNNKDVDIDQPIINKDEN